ncbi:MAG: efflux RND transporter periplasmic adaptor subunit [Phycisphaerae bacterium]
MADRLEHHAADGRNRRRAGAAALLAALALLIGCRQTPAPRPPPPPEVDVARPIVRTGVEWDEYTGRLVAVESVEVRPRVSGYIEKVHFQAGQIVQRGDLLFTIDRRPFDAELDRAKAEVARAHAVLEHAEYDLQRVESLKKTNSAPEKELQDVAFAAEQARADLDRARSGQRLAELNVEWSSIVAPISGRVSREQVTSGNLVHDGDSGATILTTIVSLDPIYCYFDTDERAYLKYARMSRSGERESSRTHPNPVKLALFDESDFTHNGHMEFVDNAMDQNTGTLRARAVVPNADGMLIPGLFARVRLLGSGERPMVFVPDAAVVTDLTHRQVFVLDDQNVAHPRQVEPGRLQNGLRRIQSGLDGSETIVVNGVQRVRSGVTVVPRRVELTEASALDGPAATQPAPAALSLGGRSAP